jgi:hypothetical protein
MIYVFYSKKANIYEIRLESPFAEPKTVDFEVWSAVLRKYNRNLNGEVSLGGSVSIEAEDLTFI